MTATFKPAYLYSAGTRFTGVALADLNKDGLPDLVVTDEGNRPGFAAGTVGVLLGQGGGAFGPLTSYTLGGTPGSAAAADPVGVAVADLDGNGTLDVVVADADNGVAVLRGDGTGGLVPYYAYGAGTAPKGVQLADVNRDGLPDVVVVDRYDSVAVRLDLGDRGLDRLATYAAGSQPGSLAVADVNGDGKPDLLVTEGGGGLAVLLGTGGSFGRPITYAAGQTSGPVVAADLDGDGRADVVTGNGSGGVSVLLGTGSGSFGPVSTYGVGGTASAVAAADLDGDGVPDLVVLQRDGGVVMLPGTGGGAFGPATTYAAGTGPVSLAVADVDGDGAPDIVVAGTGGTLAVLLNAAEPSDGTPCYCRGTRVLTDRGEVAVEGLGIGDVLVTVSGAHRPLRWIGTRAYAGRFASGNRAVLPILFRAGSLGDGLPRRDLLVSPLHAMLLDGVLIPAGALVNGTSIVQLRRVEQVEYYHLELDSHDVILAEGAPSETFVDDDSRGMFHNAHEYAQLYPDAAPCPALFCAPRLEDGYAVEAVRARLAAHARLLGAARAAA